MRDFEPARHRDAAPTRVPVTQTPAPAPAIARPAAVGAPHASLDQAAVTGLQRTAGNRAVVQLLGEDQPAVRPWIRARAG